MWKMLLFLMTRFQLILISCLVGFSLMGHTQESSKESILMSFYSSAEYRDYLQQKPITQQMIITIEIIEMGERVNFPNPYVARLFDRYIAESTNFSSKRVSSSVINFVPER